MLNSQQSSVTASMMPPAHDSQRFLYILAANFCPKGKTLELNLHGQTNVADSADQSLAGHCSGKRSMKTINASSKIIAYIVFFRSCVLCWNMLNCILWYSIMAILSTPTMSIKSRETWHLTQDPLKTRCSMRWISGCHGPPKNVRGNPKLAVSNVIFICQKL